MLIGPQRQGVYLPNRRTPIEQAIAEKSDRRVKYDRSMREKGNTRVTCWVPEKLSADLRALMGALVDCEDAEAHRAAVAALTQEIAK